MPVDTSYFSPTNWWTFDHDTVPSFIADNYQFLGDMNLIVRPQIPNIVWDSLTTEWTGTIPKGLSYLRLNQTFIHHPSAFYWFLSFVGDPNIKQFLSHSLPNHHIGSMTIMQPLWLGVWEKKYYPMFRTWYMNFPVGYGLGNINTTRFQGDRDDLFAEVYLLFYLNTEMSGKIVAE